MSLRTEFLAPLIVTVPDNGGPGSITNWVVECWDIAASITRVTMQRRTLLVDADGLADLRQPIDGIVLEGAADADRFELLEGPFSRYERELAVTASPTSDGRSPTWHVVETTSWKLGVPIFWVIFWLPFWLHVRGGQSNPSPWWAPSGRLDARTGRVIGLLGMLAIINGFVGTVIGQTLTYAADEFCGEFEVSGALRTCIDPAHDTSARANVLTIVRISIVLSLALTVAADRIGRKRALQLAVTASCVATALGALAPSLSTLTATQVVARGLASGITILIGVVAAEELPPKSRAYGVSMLILLAGLGAGMVVWVLPSADIAEWGWRIVYAVAIIFVPLALWATAQLPATRRFAQVTQQPLRRSLTELRTNEQLRKRLLLLGAAALLGAMFANPASQFDNQFLRDELGFSATRITFFTLLTSTPIGIGVMAGGILADRIGRRPVGAFGTAVGVTLTVLSFFSGSIVIFPIRAIGVILGAGFAVAGLAVYGPELFPTRLRSTANGVITAFGVTGSVIGFQLVGRLAEHFGSFGPALLIAAIGPAIVVVLILTLYPETANRTLEDINDEVELTKPTSGHGGP